MLYPDLSGQIMRVGLPSLQDRARATESTIGATAAASPYDWHNVVIGGTGFVTGVVFHPAVRVREGRELSGLVHPRLRRGGRRRLLPLRLPGRHRGGVTGVCRSEDAANTWRRINDDQHQWDWIGEAITGDRRVPGVVYLAANGRGTQFGQSV